MSTQPVTSSIASLPEVGSRQEAPSNELGKDAFLRLLTTQLQNQDPLSPLDSKDFIAQLAQFSSVEQLDQIGSRLDTVLAAQISTNQLGTASLVGRDVSYRSDRISLTQGSSAPFEISLGSAADDAVAIVADRNGTVVRTLQLGARPAGTSSAVWDGRSEDGTPLPTGDYVLTVAATRKDGTRVEAASSLRGTVTGVSFEGTAPALLVGGRSIPLSDVVQVTTASTSGA